MTYVLLILNNIIDIISKMDFFYRLYKTIVVQIKNKNKNKDS